MDWIGQFHPQIVHTPIVLLIFSAFFSIVGWLFDRDWVRKASVLMLVFGFVGAYAAVQSGQVAHRVPEHQQGVPEHDIDEHAEAGHWTLYLAGAALVAVAVASRLKGTPATAIGALAVVLQLMAAAAVGVTGLRGGKLVYDHGAHVRIGGVLVRDLGAGAARPAGPDSVVRVPAVRARPDRDDD
jgi:uncharacterized membrane protein